MKQTFRWIPRLFQQLCLREVFHELELRTLSPHALLRATTMHLILAMSIGQYLRTYKRYAFDFWENLTPMQYGAVLLTVFVAGFLLMKSSR
ncbi:hypothetical protein AB1L42_12835 [Thalassoglobus sp. JC818]|uniref:hypothetical protein n=1 Tax=Thalassoglobus sp. JC818 TaxID=3232136 RepID=UPI003457D2DD